MAKNLMKTFELAYQDVFNAIYDYIYAKKIHRVSLGFSYKEITETDKIQEVTFKKIYIENDDLFVDFSIYEDDTQEINNYSCELMHFSMNELYLVILHLWKDCYK